MTEQEEQLLLKILKIVEENIERFNSEISIKIDGIGQTIDKISENINSSRFVMEPVYDPREGCVRHRLIDTSEPKKPYRWSSTSSNGRYRGLNDINTRIRYRR